MITTKNFQTTYIEQLDSFYKGCTLKVYGSQGNDIFLTKHKYRGHDYFVVSHNEKVLSSHEELTEAKKTFNDEKGN